MTIGFDPRSIIGIYRFSGEFMEKKQENKKKDQYIIGLLGYHEVRAHHMTKCDIRVFYQIFWSPAILEDYLDLHKHQNISECTHLSTNTLEIFHSTEPLHLIICDGRLEFLTNLFLIVIFGCLFLSLTSDRLIQEDVDRLKPREESTSLSL